MANASEEISKMKLEVSQVTRTKSIFNKNQIQLLYRRTPTKHTFKRPARGGGEWDFVKGYFVRQNLNSLFGFDWDFVLDDPSKDIFRVLEAAILTGEITVTGSIVGRVVDDSGRIRTVQRSQAGRKEVQFKKDSNKQVAINPVTEKPQFLSFGNDYKAAITDCLKKCASQLGIAADIYDKDEFMEIVINDSDDDKQSATKAKVKKAKKLLAAESEKVGEQNEGN